VLRTLECGIVAPFVCLGGSGWVPRGGACGVSVVLGEWGGGCWVLGGGQGGGEGGGEGGASRIRVPPEQSSAPGMGWR
jgi:hypothetical protein